MCVYMMCIHMYDIHENEPFNDRSTGFHPKSCASQHLPFWAGRNVSRGRAHTAPSRPFGRSSELAI